MYMYSVLLFIVSIRTRSKCTTTTTKRTRFLTKHGLNIREVFHRTVLQGKKK